MLRSLEVLRNRDFSLLTLSTLLLFAARWMEVVVLGWLILEWTNSPFLLGLAGTFRFIGWGLGPLAGAISDRLERRRLVIVAQGLNALAVLGLLALLSTDRLQVWHIFAAVLVGGTTFAFDYPSRNALVGELAGSEGLLNAVAVNRAAQNVTAVVGPLLGASFLLVLGYPGAYGLVVAMYLANLLVLLPMSGALVVNSKEREPVGQGLRQGFSYFLREPPIRGVLILAALANLLAFPLLFALMPVFARDVLGVGVGGLGLMTAAVAVGALVGNLLLASRGSSWHRGKVVTVGFALWPLTLVGFALSSWYPLSLGLLFVGGIFQDLAMVSSGTLLLALVSGEMWGKVMGVRGLMVAALPVGNLIAGALTEQWGAPNTLLIMGGLSTLGMGAVLLSAPQLRRRP